jgi:uncharacterized protein (DUF924 family)
MAEANPSEVVEFWQSIGEKAWFARNDEVDQRIRGRFLGLHGKATRGELENWRRESLSCLALIILLDQFSRNLYRNDARAFTHDGYARAIATDAIVAGLNLRVEPQLAMFFYLPFMHSESIADQRRCVRLMHQLGNAEGLKFAIIHHDIILRFGRFPHRNPALGRHTTPAERAFLEAGGFGG